MHRQTKTLLRNLHHLRQDLWDEMTATGFRIEHFNKITLLDHIVARLIRGKRLSRKKQLPLERAGFVFLVDCDRSHSELKAEIEDI